MSGDAAAGLLDWPIGDVGLVSALFAEGLAGLGAPSAGFGVTGLSLLEAAGGAGGTVPVGNSLSFFVSVPVGAAPVLSLFGVASLAVGAGYAGESIGVVIDG